MSLTIIVGCLMTIAGMLLCAAGVYLYSKDKESCTLEIEAVCSNCRIEDERYTNSNTCYKQNSWNVYKKGTYFPNKSAREISRKRYYGTYEYNYNGKDYTYVDKNGRTFPISIGDTMNLKINPDNPAQVSRSGLKQMMLVGALSFVAGIVIVISQTV